MEDECLLPECGGGFAALYALVKYQDTCYQCRTTSDAATMARTSGLYGRTYKTRLPIVASCTEHITHIEHHGVAALSISGIVECDSVAT
eukprot:IDg20801t1